MSKTLPPGGVSGENVGILRLSRKTAESTAAAAAALIAAGHERGMAGRGDQPRRGPTTPLGASTSGVAVGRDRLPEDLARARDEVYPGVAAALGPLAADHEGFVHRRAEVS